MNEVNKPRVHDLLQIDPALLTSGYGAEPHWVQETLFVCPWVVVRRAQTSRGHIPVGVRGTTRSDRWGGFCDESQIRVIARPELATGRRVTNEESDLDLVVRAPQRIALEEARFLLDRTLGLEVKVDVRVETPLCGFALEEYALESSPRILLRYAEGARLGEDPWQVES